jgi:hypothetical protein
MEAPLKGGVFFFGVGPSGLGGLGTLDAWDSGAFGTLNRVKHLHKSLKFLKKLLDNWTELCHGCGLPKTQPRRSAVTTLEDLDDLDLDGPVSGPGAISITVRLQPTMVAVVDNWIGRHGPPYVSRPEAVRRLAVKGLKAGNESR